MQLPDVNLLVYAHRTELRPHARCRRLIDEIASGPAPFALSTLVAVAFVRVVTQRAFAPPTPTSVALSVIDTLAARRNCRWVAPGPRHWTLVRDLCVKTGAAGKLVADAQHAAVALEHGCELLSADADFQRFEAQGLRFRWVDVGVGQG